MATPKPTYETALTHIDTSVLSKQNKNLSIKVHEDYAFITIRTKADDAKATAALAELKLKLPQPLATTGSVKRALMMWLSPDEYVLRVKRSSQQAWLEKLTTALKKTFSAVVDSSGTYTMLDISGEKMTETLSKLINYDLKNNFPKGKVVSTLAGSAPVILFKVDAKTMQAMVRFSYSAYFYQALKQSAQEYL